MYGIGNVHIHMAKCDRWFAVRLQEGRLSVEDQKPWDVSSLCHGIEAWMRQEVAKLRGLHTALVLVQRDGNRMWAAIANGCGLFVKE